MGKLFGTDGIRGIVGENLTAELAFRVGQAVTHVLFEEKGEKPFILIADEIEDIVRTMLADNVKARELHADGAYYPVPAEGEAVNAQESFLREASHSRSFEE